MHSKFYESFSFDFMKISVTKYSIFINSCILVLKGYETTLTHPYSWRASKSMKSAMRALLFVRFEYDKQTNNLP